MVKKLIVFFSIFQGDEMMRRNKSEPQLSAKLFNFSFYQKDSALQSEKRKLVAYLSVCHAFSALCKKIREKGVPDMLFETEKFRFYVSTMQILEHVDLAMLHYTEQDFLNFSGHLIKSADVLLDAFQHPSKNKLNPDALEIKDKLEHVTKLHASCKLAEEKLQCMLQKNLEDEERFNKMLQNGWRELMPSYPLSKEYINENAGDYWLDKDTATQFNLNKLSILLDSMAKCGALAVFRAFLEKLNDEDRQKIIAKFGSKMLMSAIYYQHKSFIEELLILGADVNGYDLKHATLLTPLMFAMTRLIYWNTTPNDDEYYLADQKKIEKFFPGKINKEHAASTASMIEIIHLLLKHGADPDKESYGYQAMTTKGLNEIFNSEWVRGMCENIIRRGIPCDVPEVREIIHHIANYPKVQHSIK